jgi:hypothetical protein
MESNICKICKSTYSNDELHTKDDCIITLIKNQSLAMNELNNKFEAFKREAVAKQNALEGEISLLKAKKKSSNNLSEVQTTKMMSKLDLTDIDLSMSNVAKENKETSEKDEDDMPERSFWDWFGEFNFSHPKTQPNINLYNIKDNFDLNN